MPLENGDLSGDWIERTDKITLPRSWNTEPLELPGKFDKIGKYYIKYRNSWIQVQLHLEAKTDCKGGTK